MNYEVHVHGPDDVIPTQTEAAAQQLADEINDLDLEHVSAHVVRSGVCEGCGQSEPLGDTND